MLSCRSSCLISWRYPPPCWRANWWTLSTSWYNKPFYCDACESGLTDQIMKESSYLRHHAEIGQEDSQGVEILLRPPTCSELEASLEARIRFLEAVYTITNVTYHTQFRTQALYVIHARLLRRGQAERCPMYGAQHALYRCSAFNTLHVTQHRSIVERIIRDCGRRAQAFTNVDPVTTHNCLARSAQSASLAVLDTDNNTYGHRHGSVQAILHALMRSLTKDPKYCSFSKPRVDSVCSETCVYRC